LPLFASEALNAKSHPFKPLKMTFVMSFDKSNNEFMNDEREMEEI
jgi:hypothetical protein